MLARMDAFAIGGHQVAKVPPVEVPFRVEGVGCTSPPRHHKNPELVEAEGQRLVACGILEGPMASSTVISEPHLVPKPDSSWRFAVDYKRVNGLQDKQHASLKLLSQLLDRLAKFRYFAKFDLKWGVFSDTVGG